MNEPTTASIRSDFHRSLLWLRSMEIAITWGRLDDLVAEIDSRDLFRTYVSPIKA